MKHSVGPLRHCWYLGVLVTWFGLVVGAALAADGDYLRHKEGDEWIMDIAIVIPNGPKFTATGHRKVEASIERDGKSYHTVRGVI